MNAENFWEIGFPDEFELEEISVTAVKEVEKKLNKQLPNSYVELLKIKNGGRVHETISLPNCIPLDEYEKEDLPIDYLLGVSTRECEGILTTISMTKEWDLPKDLVLLCGDGHWWLAFDYRGYEGDNPPLVYYDSEFELDILVAENFEQFLSSLVVEEPLDYSELDDDIDDYVFEGTMKDLDKAIRKNDMATMADGIMYGVNNDWDFHYLLDKMIEIVNKPDFYTVFTCAFYFWKKVETISRDTIDEEKMKILLEKMTNYPKKQWDIEEIVPRMARRIRKSYLENDK